MSDPDPILISCIGVETDLDLLPHYLDHYLGLGVRPERMHLILNAPDTASPGLQAACAILASRGVERWELWKAPYTSAAMWEKRREFQAREAAPDDWVISADVDELHEYPASLHDFLKYCDAGGFTCVQGPFIDRLAPMGALARVRAEPGLFEQFPVAAEVIWSLAGRGKFHDLNGTVKLMAMKGRIPPSLGGHSVLRGAAGARYASGVGMGGDPRMERPAFRFACPLKVHHFHWTKSLPERLRRRIDTPGVSRAGKEYALKQLAHFDRHGGVDLRSVAVLPEGNREADWRTRLRWLRASSWAYYYAGSPRRIIAANFGRRRETLRATPSR